MANNTLVYHPPKKDPSFFNEHTISGLLSGTLCAMLFGSVSLPLILTMGSVGGLIGGYSGKRIEETQQATGIIAKKPTGIMNGAMVLGGLLFGLLGFCLAPLAPTVLATGTAVAAFTAASATFGGLLYGAVADKNRENTYNMALQQQVEREGIAQLVDHAKQADAIINSYKNIPDLTQNHDHGTQHQDVENMRSEQIYVGRQ